VIVAFRRRDTGKSLGRSMDRARNEPREEQAPESAAPDDTKQLTPQPERAEPKLRDPGLRDLSRRDYVAIVKRAVKGVQEDQLTDSAAALAYYAFLSLPSLLLLAVGVFSLVAGPDAINTLMDKLGQVAPAETVTVVRDSLERVTQNQSGGLVLVLIGGAVALWTATGAMTAIVRAVNVAYDRKETRGFVRLRVVALAMLVFAFLAFLLAFGLLILGPHASGWIGSALGIESVFTVIWWIAQWPILIAGLLLAFAAILYLAPNVEHPRWQFLTPGAVVAVVVWLVASGAFALYVSMFGSYNKAWGSLAAVIIMLTWLWLSGLALLFGAEINAETERSRELRRGEPAERELQAPPKSE
jgi:membrane protein